MLFRPDADDLRVIGLNTSKVVYGIAAAMLLPALLGLALGEGEEALGFVVGAAIAGIAGAAGGIVCRTRAQMSAGQGLATVAVAWLVVPVFAAIPLLLSGHYLGFLDAYFEAVSGLTTTGLTLVNDLDHMAWSVRLWRHLTHLLGGQAFVIVALTAFASASGPAGSLYTGEGESERILPNVLSSAKFILKVVAAYAAVAIPVLWGLVWAGGVGALESAFHAVALFASAFSTAGFAPTSRSVALYHSPWLEWALIVVMVAGALSFAIHYQLWQGRRRELGRNLETRTLGLSLGLVLLALLSGLVRTGTFDSATELLRHGLFQTVSAHTTTGLTTVPDRLLVVDWGALAPAMLVVAMALGGMAGSTAGGIKAIRVGVLLKGVSRDIRRVLLPESAVVVETYHSGGRHILRDDQVRGAAVILLLYVSLYLAGGILGLFYEYGLRLAMFESTAAAATGGMSVGLVRPELEWQLKAAYILQMVVGRLEFIAVLALAGYLVALVRGRR